MIENRGIVYFQCDSDSQLVSAVLFCVCFMTVVCVVFLKRKLTQDVTAVVCD